MKLNSKKKCIYIKNIYISKNPKLNNTINSHFENKKLVSDYNVNKKDISTASKQVPKKSVKTFYQNIYSQKGKQIQKNGTNFLSTKNIHVKSPKKEMIEDPNLFENYIEAISGRKSGQKRYEVTNPFKERSNSENSNGYLTRTYSFFGNNNKNNIVSNNISNNNMKENKKYIVDMKNNNSSVNISSKNNNELKINITSINFNKNIYNIKNNNIKQNKKNNNLVDNTNTNSYLKKSGTNTTLTQKNTKKYFYKDQPLKKNTNPKILNIHSNINAEKEKENQKEALNSTEPISSQINILSPNLSLNSGENVDMSSLKNSKRIQKYILSDKKRKTKSRQNYRDYKCKEAKSKSICPEQKKQVNSPKKNTNNFFENKFIKNKSCTPISGENGKNMNKTKGRILNKQIEDKIFEKNNNYQMIPRYYYEKDSSIEGLQDLNKNGILFEQSALIIQSVFRGYLVKSRLETYLFNYKFYNKAIEILENLFTSYLKNKSGIENEKKLFLLNFSNLTKSKNIKSYKSCKTFKIMNMPQSPLTESDVMSIQNKFVDLYLHKEIGERFNIIKQNTNREKELEKKHKEELDDVNNKIIKLIKENNILKNINQKNKINESKYKELSLENKKKENIINIITNDNQNLAKKLKDIKEKINKLEIQNPINIIIYSESQNKDFLYKYNNTKELFEAYRNLYIFFLIKKKEERSSMIIKKYFYKYKNCVNEQKYENALANSKKEKNLSSIIMNIENKKNKILHNYFTKLYYESALNKKEIDFKKDIKSEKLKNLLIKKEKINKMSLKFYFNSFYNKSLLSEFTEEKAKLEESKKLLILKKLKRIITSIDKRKNIYIKIKYKNCFTKWALMSRILSMKAVTDEKKRKKRMKQRTKRKMEKNKSMNKFMLSSSMSQQINLDKNIINTYYKEKTNKNKKEKEKDKEKDKEKEREKDLNLTNYLEHTVTTDFSLAETNNEIKTEKIIKGTEKLNDILIKAAIFYKIFGNKNNATNISLNKENINNKINDKEKNEIKVINNNEINDSEGEEDSGESSFGI